MDPRGGSEHLGEAGIATDEEFDHEHELHQFLKDWLTDRTLRFDGKNAETDRTEKIEKLRAADILEVEINPATDSGFGDIGIHHTGLHLAYDHVLGNPFIIECKRTHFRDAAAQAVRYKSQSAKKYQEQGDYKVLETGIATPRSLTTGEIAGRHMPPRGEDADDGDDDYKTYLYPVTFEVRRVYWKLGIGVVQSPQPATVYITFNEQDQVVIR